LKSQFLTALALLIIALALFSNLSSIHSVIKIPIRIATLLIMLTPIYIVMYKNTPSIKAILFQKSFTVRMFFQTLFIAFMMGLFASLIHYFTYTGEYINFAHSLHYKEYLPFYLTFGYFIEAFLQDVILVLIYEGLILFVTDEKKSFLLVIVSFGLAHLFFGIFTAMLTFLTAIIFLLIYKKLRNVLALSFVHYLVGVVSIAFGWT